ncbi:GGDEF domain-containing protein [Pararhizobium haloflavum]|uniref:GGDEF domain-containing protein n=1 Tax=Pararhizobium haloflavum TaxID=2037914 RepID=UPI000C17C56D|nr:GGDEF domain-containing protein [Pararhizobium haloflavum]
MSGTGHKSASIDVAARISVTLRRLGLPGLPRNYELVYEAYSGSNADLQQAFQALGDTVTQAQMDALGRRFLVHHHGEGIVADAQARIQSNIEECLALLRNGQSRLEDYGRVLDKASGDIARTDALKVDIIRNFIEVLTTATDTSLSDSRGTIKAMVARSGEIERVRTELDDYRRMAHTDVLTQLSNRRAFDDMLAHVYDDPKNALYFALVIADIDHFKRINDSFGHPVGDRVIKLIGMLFRAALRKDVFIARTGGEEFAFILAGTTAEETLRIADRIRTSVEATPFVNQRTGANYGPITLSLGVCMASDADNAEDLYRKADAALYGSKNRGRNRVTMHGAGVEGALSDARAMYRKESA